MFVDPSFSLSFLQVENTQGCDGVGEREEVLRGSGSIDSACCCLILFFLDSPHRLLHDRLLAQV